MASQANGYEFEQTLVVVKSREAWSAAVPRGRKVGYNWATEQQQIICRDADAWGNSMLGWELDWVWIQSLGQVAG